MKILELISSTGYYGAERVLITLSKHLQKGGVEVIVGNLHDPRKPSNEMAERASDAGLPVSQIPCGGRVDLGVVRKIRRHIRDVQATLIHTHGYKADLYARLACWGFGNPLVATYHHGTTHHDSEPWTMRLYDKLDCRALRSFDHVVAVSDPIRDFLHGAGVSERKLSIIRNGIDLDNFEEVGKADLRHDLSLGNARTIGMVGRLHPEKGPQELLRAAPTVLKRIPDVVFVLVGDGPQREELRRLARDLGIEKSVRFAGVRTDMAGVYRSLDVVVLPSLNEGLPMTLIEAMAMRRPVVATEVGGVPELIQTQETGILVKSGDPSAMAHAVLELVREPARAARMAAKAQDLVKTHYSAARMTQEYLGIFRRLCVEQ